MSERDALHPLGTSPQTRWLAAKDRIDMATPGPPPRPVTLDTTPQRVTLDLGRTVLDGHRHAERLLRRRRLGRSPRRRLHARPRADRAAAAPAAGAGARPAGRWCGSTGATGPTSPTCRPNQHHLYKPRRGRASASATRCPARRARAREGQLGGRRGRRAGAWSRATSASTSTASAASGTRRSTRSCATSAPARCCSPASTPTSACCARCTDANFLGYGCVLLEDCCATTSPAFCTEATVWNVRKCFGFVTDSSEVLRRLATNVKAGPSLQPHTARAQRRPRR